MALAVHFQLNPRARPFVPTKVVAPRLAYHHRKRGEKEEPGSKHQIRSGNGRSAGRRGVGRPNPRRETEFKGNTGNRERRIFENITKRRKRLARKRRWRGTAEWRLVRQSETRN